MTDCEILENVAQDPYFETEPSDVQVNVNDTGQMPCIIKNAGDLKCFWKKNDMAVDVKERYQYAENVSSNGHCSLIIYKSTINDTGMWSCGLEGTSSKSGITTKAPVQYTVYRKSTFCFTIIYYENG